MDSSKDAKSCACGTGTACRRSEVNRCSHPHHAHLDHSGYLPLLVKHGFRGPIYASQGTRDLAEIILEDAGHLQEEDARRANRYGYTKHHPALPLYTEDDAKRAIDHIRIVDFDKPIRLSNHLHFHPRPLGSYFGFFFRHLTEPFYDTCLLRRYRPTARSVMHAPAQIKHADYLLMESTYGNRLHPKTDVIDELAEVINTTAAAAVQSSSLPLPSAAPKLFCTTYGNCAVKVRSHPKFRFISIVPWHRMPQICGAVL